MTVMPSLAALALAKIGKKICRDRWYHDSSGKQYVYCDKKDKRRLKIVIRKGDKFIHKRYKPSFQDVMAFDWGFVLTDTIR